MRNLQQIKRIAFILLLTCTISLHGQIVNNSKSTDNTSNNLKFTGYIQTQFQTASEKGASTIAGGNFAPHSQNRFMIRRARLKANYSFANTEYVLQLAANESSIGIDEAYIRYSEPLINTFSFKAGIFDRPFGFETGYSSSKIEYCERSRVIKSLLPDEKDLGFMLSIHNSKILNIFTLDAGIFNGTGPKHTDFDSYKDFICHLYFNKTLFKNSLIISGGYSYHLGGFSNQLKSHYVYNSNGFENMPNDSMAISPRNYHGIDAQLSLKSGLGLSTFRTEYIFGTQSSTELSNTTPDTAPVGNSNKPLASYYREFTGGYFLFLQDIAKTKLQLTFRYDWLDPNSKAKADEIGVLNKTGKADIKYSTFGMGCNYFISPTLKLTAYFENVINESTKLTAYTSDRNDNIFTLRCQYKF